MADSVPDSLPDLSFRSVAVSVLSYVKKNPLETVLFLAVIAVFVYFFGYVPLWNKGLQSTSSWAQSAWNPEMNQEHSWLVIPAVLFLVWYHRDQLAAAPKEGSLKGLIWLFAGILMFVLAARTVQPRLALVSLPFLIFGSIYYLWGWRVARILLFPCAFLIFTVPFGALEQATFKLQFIITGLVGALSHLFGIKIQAVGTTLSAADDSWNFDVAEGCSGIRSLMAMTMITALYVHLTQDRLWKKVIIFFASVIFAIIGNVGRIFTIVLVAKYWSKDLAAGPYHEYSGFLFFPFALLAMLAFGTLVNTISKPRFSSAGGPPSGGAAPVAKSSLAGNPRIENDDY